ncbi:hypothetical protein PACILC2_10700 [Paenibacillus cisolokensis]|uniref:DUF58 domain-containing protein n=1 Tax=Paenibacillus cisolokensis TaxID=1658519 RepID=A0ABQ4N2V5_9BACL|nr:DUF58 domain-containing protein [Paenibacillus cisolokensis]GIQ62502.1 hypothetical protein PACILC2_10700 [Paenibacillus cisolokensis]
MSGGERETGLERLFPDMSVLYRLERMSLPAKGRFRGTMQGKRRSRALGSSLEFADYRPYAPGDDIRRIDWNVYGRTGRAFVRQYWDEQELSVCLYIDVSTSMRFGEESGRKLDYALRLAACVGYAALAGDDRAAVRLFADGIVRELPMCRGRGAAHRLFRFWTGRSGAISKERRERPAVPICMRRSGILRRCPAGPARHGCLPTACTRAGWKTRSGRCWPQVRTLFTCSCSPRPRSIRS